MLPIIKAANIKKTLRIQISFRPYTQPEIYSHKIFILKRSQPLYLYILICFLGRTNRVSRMHRFHAFKK